MKIIKIIILLTFTIYGASLQEDIKQCDNGNIESCKSVAKLYHSYHKKEWLDYMKKAALLGDGEAAYFIAQMYQFGGFGVKKDYKKAYKWYKIGAKNGYTKAMFAVGNFYCEGDVKRDKKHKAEALKWLREAAKRGSFDAMNDLGVCYLRNKQYKKAEYWFKKVAKNGAADAMYNLGDLYMIRDKNIEKAFYWYKKAANKGFLLAQQKMPLYYLYKKDDKNYIKWLKILAKKGISDAQVALGEAYLYEKYSQKKDIAKAKRLILSAAKKGNMRAMTEIATIYMLGIGGKADTKKAAYWFKKACNKGNQKACVFIKKGKL